MQLLVQLIIAMQLLLVAQRTSNNCRNSHTFLLEKTRFCDYSKVLLFYVGVSDLNQKLSVSNIWSWIIS